MDDVDPTGDRTWRGDDVSLEPIHEALSDLRLEVELAARRVTDLETERDDLRAALDIAQAGLSFFASVIKSGEPWSPECEDLLRIALSDTDGVTEHVKQLTDDLARERFARRAIDQALLDAINERDRLQDILKLTYFHLGPVAFSPHGDYGVIPAMTERLAAERDRLRAVADAVLALLKDDAALGYPIVDYNALEAVLAQLDVSPTGEST